jgi:Domain of unknown function (DUF4465)/PEP-CTERM motif
MRRVINLMAISAIALSALIARVEAAVSTFDDLPLAPNSFYFPATSTDFVSGPATYNHHYDPVAPGCCWTGWTYSNMTDTTTPGPANQYSAYPGIGAQGSANYGVAFLGQPVGPTVTFATPSVVSGAYFTNTTYAALSMLNGDSFAKKFGGTSGNDPDSFKLTIIGKNAAEQTTGTVDFYLADYRFANNSLDYIVNTWTFVDLSSLGAVTHLEFVLASTDTGDFGINTPGYFAMDNLTTAAVPEPSSIVLLLSGLAVMIGIARRRTVS